MKFAIHYEYITFPDSTFPDSTFPEINLRFFNGNVKYLKANMNKVNEE